LLTEKIPKRKIIVIGGGPAGMLAAGKCAERGNSVVLLEKNVGPGKKLLITGKGRCNITNACDRRELFDNICGNPRFLYSAISSFDNAALMDFFAGLGLETKVERGNRVFPVSDRSADVIKTLEQYVKSTGAQIRLNTEVSGIKTVDGHVTGVYAGGGFMPADSVIVATGGLSYPATGSTGDGFRFAESAGHSITKLYPSLVPLVTKENWVKELQGLSLKNIEITAKRGETVLYKDFGELLFTHFGVSGPVILSASRYFSNTYGGDCAISIDLKPALSEEQLDKRVLRDFSGNLNKVFKNSLDALLPQKLIPVIVRLSGIDGSKRANEITRDERRNLVRLLKNLSVTIKAARGFNEAVITVGGVAVDEINPKTMESKLIKGLYFCGEVLDVDAYTGGFNLQIAFSTGYAAGSNA